MVAAGGPRLRALRQQRELTRELLAIVGPQGERVHLRARTR